MTEGPSPSREPATEPEVGSAIPGDPRAKPPSDQERRQHRPSAVTVVAVTYLVLAVAWAVLTIQRLVAVQIFLPPGGGILDTEAIRRSFTLLGGIVAIRQVAVGVTAFVAAIALLRMHPRGWLLGMVAAVIVLSVQLISWYDTTPSYPLMAITVAVVLLMNQAEVRDAFGEDVSP